MPADLLLFDLIRLLDDGFDPCDCKVHLASHNGLEDPLDVYIAGEFDEWQRRQNNKNFERPLVLSLIKMGGQSRWLFAGLHDAGDSIQMPDGLLRYDIRRREMCDSLDGRLVVSFERTRNAYRKAETVADKIHVREIMPERLSVPAFPGFTDVMLEMAQLRTVVRLRPESWATALSSVGGVYLITDRSNGLLYVGSATGQEGLWSRWCSYAKTGHGGNRELRAILKAEGTSHDLHFQFSILEIADRNVNAEQLLARESHWKGAMMTRDHGYNKN